MKKFESALRHIRFEIIPTDYQYPQSWINNGWTPRVAPNNLPFEEWKVVTDGIEEEIRADASLISQASDTNGVQLGKIAKSAGMKPEAFLEKLNQLEANGKIRFRQVISLLDQHKEFAESQTYPHPS